MSALPISLDHPPLVEALVEIRFEGVNSSVGDILPGLIYQSLRDDFPHTQTLETAYVPRVTRESNPHLRYRPHMRLESGREAILIGDRVLLVAKRPPYEGWGQFRTLCDRVLGVLRATQLVQHVERHSFKCVNLIKSPSPNPLDPLAVDLHVGPYSYVPEGFLLRTEFPVGTFTNILEVASASATDSKSGTIDHVMISIDTISGAPLKTFLDGPMSYLDAAHDTLKAVFFSLLKPDTVATLGPKWPAGKS